MASDSGSVHRSPGNGGVHGNSCPRDPRACRHRLFSAQGLLWIQQGLGLTAVFVVIAVMVVIAAVAVTQIGPKAKGLALDEIAPPTA